VIASVTVHVNPNLPWYIARSSGIVAWALVTASVIWGLAFSGKLTRHPKLPSAAWMLDLHRFLGGMAVIFTGFHIGGLMMDKFVGYGPAQIAVPFTGTYRPVATAWGIIGCYLLLSIELTSLVMSRLPRRVWHGIHLSSFGVFTLVTVHGLSTGTDARHGVLPLTMMLAAIVVAMLTGMRAQIAITKRAERAVRAERSGGAVLGMRSVRAGTRPMRQPAHARAASGDGDGSADARPVRALERPRPVRPELDRAAPVLELPARPDAEAADAQLRPRPGPRRVERTTRPMVPAAASGARPTVPAAGYSERPTVPATGYSERPTVPATAYSERPSRPIVAAAGAGDQSMAPGSDRDEQFRPVAPALAPDPSPAMAGPSGDRPFAPRPYVDPRYAPGPYAGSPPRVHRVPADGRGADEQRPTPERPFAADGRGGVPRRRSADGRSAEDSDMPSGRVVGRLP
jgi:DMSO/TMAO reductase YedYZ heme-binding membrane subunit